MTVGRAGLETILDLRASYGIQEHVDDDDLRRVAADLGVHTELDCYLGPTGLAVYADGTLFLSELAPWWLRRYIEVAEPPGLLAHCHWRAFVSLACIARWLDIMAWHLAFPLGAVGSLGQDRTRILLAAGWLAVGEWPLRQSTWPGVAQIADRAGWPVWLARYWSELAARQQLDRWYWRLRAS